MTAARRALLFVCASAACATAPPPPTAPPATSQAAPARTNRLPSSLACAPAPPACANCPAEPSEKTQRKASDKEVIRLVIRRHVDEARACYRTLLATQPSAQGKVMVRFGIDGSGAVATSCLVSSDFGVPSVDACLLDRVLTWRFPKPQGGGWVVVQYPFIFVP